MAWHRRSWMLYVLDVIISDARSGAVLGSETIEGVDIGDTLDPARVRRGMRRATRLALGRARLARETWDNWAVQRAALVSRRRSLTGRTRAARITG